MRPRLAVRLAAGSLWLAAAAAQAAAPERYACRLGTARWLSARDAGELLAQAGVHCEPAPPSGSAAGAAASADEAGRPVASLPAAPVPAWPPVLLIVGPDASAGPSSPPAGAGPGLALARRDRQEVLALQGLVRDAASRAGLDPDLAQAVAHVESNLDPLAQSPRGALGLMQIMPATASDMGVQNRQELLRPATNARLGVTYLRAMLERFAGEEALALAAYNAGPGAVQRAGLQVPPFPETQRYVARVLSLRWSLRQQRDLP